MYRQFNLPYGRFNDGCNLLLERAKWFYFIIAKPNDNKCGYKCLGFLFCNGNCEWLYRVAGTTLITVNPIPASPSVWSNGPLCAGSTLNLSASTVAGASYSWTGPNGFSSSLQNPVINNVTTANAGAYAVNVTVQQCTSPSAVTPVTINSIPVTPVVSAFPVCEGMNLNLTASLIPGATYSWIGPNGFISSNQNPTIANAGSINAGTYNVTVTANGCTSTAASVTSCCQYGSFGTDCFN
jgi:hypothetical protein